MKYKNGEKIILILLFLFVILNFCSLKEGYGNYSNNVDLPINTTYSCKNMCGPHATCSLTGEQCTSDIDCYGCQPKNQNNNNISKDVNPYNDSGKLTDMTPNKSFLTSDIGSRAYYFDNKINSPALYNNKGINTWRETFDEEQYLYNKRYNPSIYYTQTIPNYKARPTLTGEFMVKGPAASNATL
jgi:hypothetical protein